MFFAFFVCAFAFLYTHELPDDFRYADIDKSSEFQAKKAEISALLEKHLEEAIPKSYGYERLQKDFAEYEVRDSSLTVQAIKDRSGDRLTFEADTIVAARLLELPEESQFTHRKSQNVGPGYFEDCAATIQGGEGSNHVRLQCRKRLEGFVFDIEAELQGEDGETIARYIHAETRLIEGLFSRMLYFSAVTATTLGYGDIVPISKKSRLVVAFQSIFGLVLMGLLVFWTTSGSRREVE
ncbi:MAG: potassium channel family protein [Erythrobacter sp.]